MRKFPNRFLTITLVAVNLMVTVFAMANERSNTIKERVNTIKERIDTITVSPSWGDDTRRLQAAVDSVARMGGEQVVLTLKPGVYNLSRREASRHLYHVSNTASAQENPDQTKYIGLWLRNLRNVTIDGRGATLVTHGEMTSIVVDSCENITLRNFRLTAADPSVTEFKVLTVEPRAMTIAVTPPSRYEIDSEGGFSWVGEGWRFADGSGRLPELAQVYYPESNVTLRCPSPLDGRKRAVQIGQDTVRIEFDKTPSVRPDEIYQMRHGIRNEVCTFINMSRNVTLENIDFSFLGNFGIVGQFSENLTYKNLRCCPQEGSGRTNAGFADFVQMSGCRGKIRILDSRFEGAQDDPINIHGTHLKVTAINRASRTLKTRFMHPQTYGFTPFFPGDEVEIVDVHSLLSSGSAKVMTTQRLNDYEWEIELDSELPREVNTTDYAIENVTWTPEIEIKGCYFARVPTRGILITTRGKSLIEGNRFEGIPMPAILVSDDARNWYESGPVKDLTIRDNDFIGCAAPAIAVWPEVDRHEGPVHTNILIEGNRFTLPPAEAISIRHSSGVTIRDNTFNYQPTQTSN